EPPVTVVEGDPVVGRPAGRLDAEQARVVGVEHTAVVVQVVLVASGIEDLSDAPAVRGVGEVDHARYRANAGGRLRGGNTGHAEEGGSHAGTSDNGHRRSSIFRAKKPTTRFPSQERDQTDK